MLSDASYDVWPIHVDVVAFDAGPVLVGIVILAAIAGIVWFLCRRRKRSR